MRYYIAISGLAVVSAECTENDYELIGNMNVSAMATCITYDFTYDWLQCLGNLGVTSDCAFTVNQDISDNLDVCTEWCIGDSTTATCKTCWGVVATKKFSYYAPVEYGLCSGIDDRAAIADVCLGNVVDDAYIGDLPTMADSLSPDCLSCFESRLLIINELDGCLSQCETPGAPCYDCQNVAIVAAMAYCNNELPTPNCTVIDYHKLHEMDTAGTKLCIEGIVGDGIIAADDGIVECLGQDSVVGISQDCIYPLDLHIDRQIRWVCDPSICADDSTSADCLNCRGSIMVQEVFEHAPNGTGPCGDSDNLDLISTVNMEAVIACGKELASTGATCLAYQATASPLCQRCLEVGTIRAMERCEPHCGEDVTGPDCMDCVNIGLMSVTAHCNAHSSGASAITGLSIISFVVMISLTFSAL